VVKLLLDIRKREWRRVLLSFAYFYLTIASYYVLKTCRKTFFVYRLGGDNRAWVDIAIAISAAIMIFAYSRMVNKAVLRNLINASLVFLILISLLFWWAFHYDIVWLPFLFYMWVTLFGSISVTQFWTFINDLFDPQEAKRIYGLVGAGGLIGGMTGGYISAYFAPLIGVQNLILLSSGITFLCIIIVSYLWKTDLHYRNESDDGIIKQKDEKNCKSLEKGTWNIIRGSRYLMLLLLLVGLMKFTTNLTEWQLDKMAEINFVDEKKMASFYGAVFGHLSSLGLIIQLLGTPFFLKRFGAGRTLALLPGGLIGASIILFICPVVWAVALLKIIDGSLRYSINQSAKEYVYLPINKKIRYKIKPFIDIFIYQGAKGIAGLFVVIINSFIFVYLTNRFPDLFDERLKVLLVSVIVFIALFSWFIVVWKLIKAHDIAMEEFDAATMLANES